MKKLTTLWMMTVMLLLSIPAMSAMSKSKMRENARFLTDRMAYELRLSERQYDDVYEVNYDFIDNIRHFMDDVVKGYPKAIDRYYKYLDYRNDDLRWILSVSQYRKFMGVDYFCRPIYTTASKWLFRIHKFYTDVHHFYFKKPHHYKTYNGAHFRKHYGYESYYKKHRKDHYRHDFYHGKIETRRDIKPHDVRRRPEKIHTPRRKPVKVESDNRFSAKPIRREADKGLSRRAKER